MQNTNADVRKKGEIFSKFTIKSQPISFPFGDQKGRNGIVVKVILFNFWTNMNVSVSLLITLNMF